MWPVILETVIQNKGSLRNCYGQEEPKGTCQLGLIWCPGWDPVIDKRTLGEN